MTINIDNGVKKQFAHQFVLHFSKQNFADEHILFIPSDLNPISLDEFNEAFELSFPNNGDAYSIVSHVVFRTL